MTAFNCACPTGSTANTAGDACDCDSAHFILDSGTCGCPTGSTENSAADACECDTAHFVLLSDNTCACPAGSTENSSTDGCDCAVGTMNTAGTECECAITG